MGFPNHNGGWWLTLDVETLIDGVWKRVEHLKIMPPYQFEDTRENRRPYEHYVLTFSQMSASGVRLIGRPGGSAEFTSLARLAVYDRDLSRWNPALLPPPPIPYAFQLISPETIHDLSENFIKLTGVKIDFPLLGYYLDNVRFREFRISDTENPNGIPNLWYLLGEQVGWSRWVEMADALAVDPTRTIMQPNVYISFFNIRASAIAPIIVENQVLGQMTTRFALLKDNLDPGWHRQFAESHAIPWSVYYAAMGRVTQLTLRQLQGAAELLGIIANSIANLAHRNLQLESELQAARQAVSARSSDHKTLVRQAIEYMQQHLEGPLRIADVARHVALSPTYFGIIFLEQTGFSPGDYLIDLRLERARHYLARTEMSVTEIAVILDYTPSYFSRLFKNRVGCSPTDYLKIKRQL
jgi:AraC-like DNA-binding protein